MRVRTSCSCCPYGFHIDRDFVYYCESLYNNTQIEKLKQKKREKHKEHRTVESYLGLNTLPPCSNECMSTSGVSVGQKIAATIYTLSQTDSSQDMVGINRNALAHIREQIATSLKCAKKMEEQIKLIPLLKVKLSILKEENQRLLNQLKNKHPNTDICPVDIDWKDERANKRLQLLYSANVISSELVLNSFSDINLTLSSQSLTSPTLAYNVNTNFDKRCFIDNEIISKLGPNESNAISEDSLVQNKSVKDVGTSCNVLTRDVGVGHIQNKYKSTGVGEDNVFSLPLCFRDRNMKNTVSASSDSLESYSDREESTQKVTPCSKPIAKMHSMGLVKPVSQCFSQEAVDGSADHDGMCHCTCANSCSLDRCLGINVFANRNVDAKGKFKNASTATDIRMSDFVPNKMEFTEILKENKSTLCDVPVKISKAVQVLLNLPKRSDATTTCDLREFASNVSLQALPSEVIPEIIQKCENTPTDSFCKMSVRSISISENISSDIVCAGYGEKNEPVCNSYCSRCSHKDTKTVGVGDIDVGRVLCIQCMKNVSKSNGEISVMMRSVGTNTSLDSLVFSSIGKSDIQLEGKWQTTTQLLEHELENSICEIESNRRFLEDSKAALCSSVGAKLLPAYLTMSTEVGSAPSIFASCDMKQKYTETVDATKGFVPLTGSKRTQLSKEVRAACKVLNDCLLKSEDGCEKKMLNSLNIIKTEWFKVANHKDADPHVIENYLDGFEEFSKLLLHHIVNLADSNGNTAIHYAVSYSNFDVVSILIDSKVCDVTKQNKAGYTCIMLVALAEVKTGAHYYVVQRLFQMGDINIKANQNGQTALMLAVSHGKIEVVKMLLDAGAEVNLQDNDGSTALMCASEHGHIDIVRLLLSHPDCDPAITDNDGSSALAIAMEAGNKDVGLMIYANMNFPSGNSSVSDVNLWLSNMIT